MGDKQTYLVETVYQTVDKTSRAAGEMEKSLKQTAQAAQSLQTVLKGLGGAFLGSRIIGEAKKHFIDYNKTMEDHKVVLAGMLTMYTGIGIDKTFDRAGQSLARFEDMAKKSSLTTADLVNTAAGLTRPLIQSGLSMKQIEDVSFGVANAAKAFGKEGTALLDVEQAIRGTVSARDSFMQSILGQKGIELTYDQFNKKSQDKRVEILKKALTSKAITDMAEKQAGTMSGVMSTLEDNFQIMASKVGLPLFKAISKEIAGWNVWIDKNQRKLSEIGQTIASGLVKGFTMMKDAFVWIYNHADTLVMIAKAYAAIKLGSMLGGGAISSLAGAVGGGAGLLNWFKKDKWKDGLDAAGNYQAQLVKGGAGRQAVGGLAGAAANAPLLGAALGAGLALGNFVNDMTGVSDSIANVIKVNGEVYDSTDKTTKQYALLAKTMNSLDKAAKDAADRLSGVKGAGGSVQAANLAGASSVAHQQQQILQSMLRDGLFDPDGPSYMKHAAKMKLEKSGVFDSDEIKNAMANPEAFMNKAGQMSGWYSQRQKAGEETANAAWDTIPEELRKSIDQQKVTAALMSKALQLMPAVKGQFNQPIILSKEMIDQVLKETGADNDIKGTQKVNQTVNITIQQVMAKDPNRWIAEMDDMVARRTRNPTRAKKAWHNRVK